MVKLDPTIWTPERLIQEDSAQLRNIRDNAKRLGFVDLVDQIDTELERRKPSRARTAAPSHLAGAVVVGYHFVCASDRGVTVTDDGRFWTGSWVVAESRVVESMSRGAYLALHEAKSEPSYRQGKIVGHRIAPRTMLPQDEEHSTEFGIEFLVEPTPRRYTWVGDGSGEKGYRWSDEPEAGAEQKSLAE